MGSLHAPLGSGRARYAPRLASLTERAHGEIAAWLNEHPSTYVAVSGGKDSTTCLHLAAQVNPGIKGLFFHSGLEFPQTLTYLDRLSEHLGVEIITYYASPTALDLMEANGSWRPGQPIVDTEDNNTVLIEQPLVAARADHGPASIYGMRADESPTRKMMLAKDNGRVTHRDRRGVIDQHYLAPIWRWSYEEVYTYLGNHGVPLNPLYRAQVRLGVPERRARVGLLVDGWALEQGRWAIARALAPDLARQVEVRLPALAEYR